MRNCFDYTIIAAGVLSLCCSLSVGAEPIRGVELDPLAPEDVVAAFAGSGLRFIGL